MSADTVVHDGPVTDPAAGTAVAARRENSTSAAVQRQSGSITDLLFTAVEKGTPVDQLKELVALHREMETHQAKKDFARAMAAFHSEARAVKHNKTANIVMKAGGKFSFTYASLDEIAEAVNPVLARHGLSYSWDGSADEKGLMWTSVCTVTHENGHSVTSTFTVPTANDSPAMNPQQRISAASKFARRLSLESALGITTTDDDRSDEEFQAITEAQANQLEDLLIVVSDGKDEKEVRARFLKAVNSNSVEKILARQFEYAYGLLTRKRGGGA